MQGKTNISIVLFNPQIQSNEMQLLSVLHVNCAVQPTQLKRMEKYNKMFEDSRINVKQKISALWAALMFIYVYVDIFSFYKPGSIEDILVGKVWEFDITQTWALGALILMTIPILMIFLALALPSKVNRWINLIVATVYIVVSIGNSVGESWAFVILGSVVELVLLALIVWHAWKWPKQNSI